MLKNLIIIFFFDEKLFGLSKKIDLRTSDLLP